MDKLSIAIAIHILATAGFGGLSLWKVGFHRGLLMSNPYLQIGIYFGIAITSFLMLWVMLFLAVPRGI